MKWKYYPDSMKAIAHGHVVPRDDGLRARCGGPALCSVCQLESRFVELQDETKAVMRKAIQIHQAQAN